MRATLLIAVVLAVGCGPRAVTPRTGAYLAGLSIVAAEVELETGVTPAPAPAPKPDGVPSPANCPERCMNGRVGDGTIMFDCAVCDRDGDGDPDDADAGAVKESLTVEWLTWPEAHAEQLRTGQPVLVLVSFQGCAPCVRLKRLLDEPGNLNRLAELGIPCLGHCRDWQTDDKTKWRAPAIVYADGREEPPMLTNLSFATADDFFDQLTGWINAND